MDITHRGMQTRIRYEVTLYRLHRGYEELWEWDYPDGYRDAVKKAKENSCKEGITHTEVVKNVEFYHPDDPEQTWDTQVEKRWIYKDGKLTAKTNW